MLKEVLLCDDEPHILRAAEFKLKRAGFQVRCASDGEEAWRAIQDRCPDLVVTDCQMPRMDGLQLVARIRQHDKTAALPVLMLTAKGLELKQEISQDDMGVIDILFKPFSPRELCQRVQKALEKSTRVPTQRSHATPTQVCATTP